MPRSSKHVHVFGKVYFDEVGSNGDRCPISAQHRRALFLLRVHRRLGIGPVSRRPVVYCTIYVLQTVLHMIGGELLLLFFYLAVNPVRGCVAIHGSASLAPHFWTCLHPCTPSTFSSPTWPECCLWLTPSPSRFSPLSLPSGFGGERRARVRGDGFGEDRRLRPPHPARAQQGPLRVSQK